MSILNQLKTRINKINPSLYPELIPEDVETYLMKLKPIDQCILLNKYYAVSIPVENIEIWIAGFCETIVEKLNHE